MTDHNYRELARELLQFAGLSDVGRTVDDPVFIAICEGRYATQERLRKTNPKMSIGRYSDCGDVAHWMYYRLGVRLPWVNRVEMGKPWSVGRNLQNLCLKPIGTNPLARKARIDDEYGPGVVLIVGATGGMAHATCVIEHDRLGMKLTTSDGGQGNPAHRIVSNKLEIRFSPRGAEDLWRGNRRVDSVLELDTVIEAASDAGLLEEPETVGEYLQRPEFQRVVTRTTLRPTRNLKQGDTGSDVAEWQKTLSIKADGIFGPMTQAATIRWQRLHCVPIDPTARSGDPMGVVGRYTRELAKRDTQPQLQRFEDS